MTKVFGWTLTALLCGVLGCDDGGGGGNTGGGGADGAIFDAAPFDAYIPPPDMAVNVCVDDDSCTDGTYCRIADGMLEGACTPGCRQGPDTCEGRTICSDAHVCEVDPNCAGDEECAGDQYCDEGSCVTGCRMVEPDLCPLGLDGETQLCDPASRRCIPAVPCCMGETCVEVRASACEDRPGTATSCFNPNPCENRCEADEDCDPEDYCGADGRCRAGCREGGCLDDACDLERRVCAPAGCQTDANCRRGLFCDLRSFECVAGCRTAPDSCPDGSFCTVARQCGEGCDLDSQCEDRNGPGWHCFRAECVAPCSGPSDCADDELCDPISRRCEPGCLDDGLEEDDSADDATPLELIGDNTYDSPPLRICPEDSDWHLFQTPGPGWDIRVEVDFRHDDGDLDARLLGPEGASFEGNSADDDELITVEGAAAGDWRLEVFGRGLDRNAYRFRLELTPPRDCVADAGEPDNSPEAAALIPLEGLEAQNRQRGRTLCRGDADWYLLPLGAGDGVSIQLFMLGNGAGEPSELDLAIFGPGVPGPNDLPAFLPNNLGGGENGPRFLAFSAPRFNAQIESGDYYIRVSGFDEQQWASYELLTRVERGRALCDADAFEPNESADAASDLMALPALTRQALDGTVELIPDRDLDVEDLWLCAGDVDVFSFDVAAGDDIDVSIQRNDDPRGDSLVQVFDAGGVLVGEGRNARAFNTARVLDAAGGRYTARISAPFEGTQTQYTLRLLRSAAPVPCGADRAEPNQTRDAANRRGIGRADGLTLCGQENDVDWYFLPVSAVSDVSIAIEFAHVQANLELDVFLDGRAVAVNADSQAGHSQTDNEAVQLLEVLPGQLAIRVSAPFGGNANYDLVVGVERRVFVCEDDPLEPNDTVDGATVLGGEPTRIDTGWLCDRVPAEADTFSFQVAANLSRTVAATFLFGDDGDLAIEILGADGTFLGTTAFLGRASSKQCIIIEPFGIDRTFYARVVPLGINRILDDDERLDYALEILDGEGCDQVPPDAPGVEWPRIDPQE